MNMTNQEQLERCLYPEVRVRTPKALGSGTVIFCEPTPGEDGMWDAYALTNEHVVENLITIKDKWNSVLKREIKTDELGHPDVEVFQFAYRSRVIGSTSFRSDIVAYDKDEDMALLRVRSGVEFKYIAQLLPEDEINDLCSFLAVWNVGCGLGGPPAITPGYLSAFGIEIDKRDYMLVTAPSIFGDSGGATFTQDTGYYIGIPARISVTAIGFLPAVVTHLGFSITPARIYQFLRDQVYDFIIDPDKTSGQCEKEREGKREADLQRRIVEGEQRN